MSQSLFKSEQRLAPMAISMFPGGVYPKDAQRIADRRAFMNREDRGPASLPQEERHRMAPERAQSAPTMAATNELPAERATFSLRIKPDRRRLVVAIDPSTERRGHGRNGRR